MSPGFRQRPLPGSMPLSVGKGMGLQRSPAKNKGSPGVLFLNSDGVRTVGQRSPPPPHHKQTDSFTSQASLLFFIDKSSLTLALIIAIMQPKEIVNLSLFWGEWSRCLTAKYQRDMLYRFGKFDDCSKQWSDVKTAMSAKFVDEEEEARKMIASTYYHKRVTTSPTEGVIWQKKEKPGW